MMRPQLILSESARLARMRPTGAEMEGYAGPRPSTNHGVPRQEPEVVPSREGLASAGVPPAATPPDLRLADASLGRASECDCPPQVEQCIHFNGAILALASNDRIPQHWMKTYHTGFIQGLSGESCPCGCGLALYSGIRLYGGPDHDAARAAFDAAAERLRRGELS